MDDTPAWGIEPVPQRLRVLGSLDHGPPLGQPRRLAARARRGRRTSCPRSRCRRRSSRSSSAASSATPMLGVAGADRRRRARAGDGADAGAARRRGSCRPTALNVAQCLGWTVFELLVIATAAAALSDELFGFGALWLWTLVFGGVALVLALLGPIGFVRRSCASSRSGSCSLARSTWRGGRSTAPASARSGTASGEGGFVGARRRRPRRRDHRLVDPARRRLHALRARLARGAFWGTGVGYLAPERCCWLLGAILFLSRDIADPAALPVAVAAGGLGAVLALLALTVDETDEAFANVYSAAVSLQNLAPRLPQRALVVADAVVGTVGALASTCSRTRASCSCSARSSCRCSPCCSRTGSPPARATSERDVFGGAGVRPGHDRRVDRRVRRSTSGSRPTGPAWWIGARRAARPAGLGHRRDAAELRRLVRAAGSRSRDARAGAGSRAEYAAHAQRRGDREPCAVTGSPAAARARRRPVHAAACAAAPRRRLAHRDALRPRPTVALSSRRWPRSACRSTWLPGRARRASRSATQARSGR